MRTFLGVDGGGTKTHFVLIDEDGRVLASRRGNSAYYLETGIDALRVMLVEGIRGTLTQASIEPGALTFAFLGLPAYGEDSTLTAPLDAIASAVLPVERYRCENDMVCGWAGALAGRDGINIIAGTGSIAYGGFDSRRARAGGWGELFSDEGSAYWIAREGLRLFSRMSDGRDPKAALYDLVREHFGVRNDLDICAAVFGPPPLTRSEIAALAPMVTRAAHAGDQRAKALLVAAADELAAIAHAVYDRLAPPRSLSLPVSYSGGLFQRDSLLLALLQTALQATQRRYEFTAPRLSPGAGAALLAAELAGVPLTPAALAQLAREQDPK